MIDGIGSTTLSGRSDASAPVKNALELTSSNFLQLLLAQFKYQDPFAPQDPTRSVGELAGLAQLSTLQEISATLQQLAGRSGGVDVAGWVGRSALIETAKAVPTADGVYAGAVQIASDTDVDVTFSGPDGQPLETLHMPAPVKAGQGFSWSGSGGAGMPASVFASSGSKPIAVALWVPITGASRPGGGSPSLDTPVGSFSPGSVLALR